VAMEIENNQGIHINAYVNQVQEKNKVDSSDNKPEKSTVKADTVVISDAAKRIQEAKTQLDNIPDVRAEKVAKLKEQVESGTYKVDAEKTADKLIKEHLINDLLK
jgi:negative regulator of flagellin synthesis FlgM